MSAGLDQMDWGAFPITRDEMIERAHLEFRPMADPVDPGPAPLPPKAPSWGRPEPRRRRVPRVLYVVAAVVAIIVVAKLYDAGLRVLLGQWIESEVCKVMECDSGGP
jgi:hypothetical protein